MRQKSGPEGSAEKHVKEIRRQRGLHPCPRCNTRSHAVRNLAPILLHRRRGCDLQAACLLL